MDLPDRLDVVTLNVWGLPWPLSRARSRRFRRIERHFERERYHLVGLQEVWWPFARDLRVPGLQGGAGGSGLAWGGDLAHRLQTRLASFRSASGTDRLASKGVLVGEVGELTVAVTHLQAGAGGAAVRRAQVDEVIAAVDGAAGPVLVMGDFNFHGPEPDSELALADAGFRDAAGDDRAPTWWPGRNPFAGGPAQRFDRIYLRDGARRRWASSQVRVLPRVLSDHQPVAATLHLEAA